MLYLYLNTIEVDFFGIFEALRVFNEILDNDSIIRFLFFSILKLFIFWIEFKNQKKFNFGIKFYVLNTYSIRNPCIVSFKYTEGVLYSTQEILNKKL